jgi:hypothetical protein
MQNTAKHHRERCQPDYYDHELFHNGGQHRRSWPIFRGQRGNRLRVEGNLAQPLAADPGLDAVAPGAADVERIGVIHGAQPTLRARADPRENVVALPASSGSTHRLGV